MDAFKSVMRGLRDIADRMGKAEVASDIQNKLDNWDEYCDSLDDGLNESAFADEEETVCELYGAPLLYYAIPRVQLPTIREYRAIQTTVGGIPLSFTKEEATGMLLESNKSDFVVLVIDTDYLKSAHMTSSDAGLYYNHDIPIEAVYTIEQTT